MLESCLVYPVSLTGKTWDEKKCVKRQVLRGSCFSVRSSVSVFVHFLGKNIINYLLGFLLENWEGFCESWSNNNNRWSWETRRVKMMCLANQKIKATLAWPPAGRQVIGLRDVTWEFNNTWKNWLVQSNILCSFSPSVIYFFFIL